ncbi:MAG: hypothetical protein RR764_11400 [Oscillospiraceae bacterium]
MSKIIDEYGAESLLCKLCGKCTPFLGICIWIWLALLLAAAIVVVVIIIIKRKKSDDTKEDSGKNIT